MSRLLGILVAVLFAAAGLFMGVMPANATPHIFENEAVCPEYEATPNKVELSGEQLSVTVTAPEGMVIVRYCVKAGSANQGDGPVPVWVDNQTSVMISHPSGKAISHYTLDFEPVVVAPPNDHILDFQPPEPVRMDYCGAESDEDVIPTDHGLPITYVWIDENTIRAVPNAGEFADGIKDEWTFEPFTDVACPVFIVDQPAAPTLCMNAVDLPDDTNQMFYAMDGENVYGVAKEGLLFVQDLVKFGLDYIVWPIADLVEVCAVVVPNPPVVAVDPPVVITPPAVEVTPVTETPVFPVEPETPVVPASVETVAEVDSTEGIESAASVVGETKLAETGFDPLPATLLAGLLIALGVAAMKPKRLRVVKK